MKSKRLKLYWRRKKDLANVKLQERTSENSRAERPGYMKQKTYEKSQKSMIKFSALNVIIKR